MTAGAERRPLWNVTSGVPRRLVVPWIKKNVKGDILIEKQLVNSLQGFFFEGILDGFRIWASVSDSEPASPV